MYRFEALATRLRVALIAFNSAVVIALCIATAAVLMAARRFAEEHVFGVLGLTYLATPFIICPAAAWLIRSAGRVKALLLMLAALWAAPDGYLCTEQELAGAARLSFDRARPVVNWLVKITYKRDPIVTQERRGLGRELTLTQTGSALAGRVLDFLGGV
jgi:hypothetical protein